MNLLKITGFHKKRIYRWVLRGVMIYGEHQEVYPRATFIRLVDAGEFGSIVKREDLWMYAEYMSHDSEHGWGPIDGDLARALEQAPVASQED